MEQIVKIRLARESDRELDEAAEQTGRPTAATVAPGSMLRTPRPATGLPTPYRHVLGVEGDGHDETMDDTASIASGATSTFTTLTQADDVLKSLRRAVKLGLANLPKPKNDFEIVAPPIPEFDDSEDDSGAMHDEDAADVAARGQQKEYEEQQARLRRRSQASPAESSATFLSSDRCIRGPCSSGDTWLGRWRSRRCKTTDRPRACGDDKVRRSASSRGRHQCCATGDTQWHHCDTAF